MAVNLIGFDSAWADNPKKPGAICALRGTHGQMTFVAPVLAGFDAAFAVVNSLHEAGDLTLIAIDQPTIVPNERGMRPTERVVAGTISWSGGGIQPAYRGKADLFGDDAPIWRLLGKLKAIGCVDEPERAVCAAEGLFVIEVYPALALLGLDDAFVAQRGCRPCYNPGNRRRYRGADWIAVSASTASTARRFGLEEVASWLEAARLIENPCKADQDKLDAVICLLVAKRWRDDRGSCAMIGDLVSGYVVAPVNEITRTRLAVAAEQHGVPIA